MMTFDMKLLEILVTSVAIPFGLYLLNRLSNLAKELEDHKLYAANVYLKKNEFQELRKEIKDGLAELKKDFHKAIDELKKKEERQEN